ncbi:MAG: hypothetical protein HON70_41465, partial [Lentisphaerae bacterium]|nr:hypothetical protein [Lentisphaerota bacterium]
HVEQATVAMIDANASTPGYTFNTGEGIMANTPRQNVEAMMRTAKNMPACQP